MRYLTNDLDAAGLPTWAESNAELSPYSGPAARFWDFETIGEHPYGGEMLVRVVTTPHGTFRACVRQDECPDAPDYEVAYPVFRVTSSRYYSGPGLDSKPELGEDSAKHDGLPYDLGYAVDHFARTVGGRDTLDVTDRWLRIFHGGSLKVLSSTMHQGGDDFVTYDTRAMRAYWGLAGVLLETSDPEADEWQSYLDGDVYSVGIERQVLDDPSDEPTWEPVEDGPVYGYYGTAWAMQAAEDELVGEIEHVAGQMLPLGGE